LYPDVPHLYDKWTHKYDILQFAPTVRGKAQGFEPHRDCDGAFMLYKNQIDNNCYAYACCVATSTYPQPGRASNGSVDIYKGQNFTAENILSNACKDGLHDVGPDMPISGSHEDARHLVALLFSAPMHVKGHSHVPWLGDYHWVRCDDPIHHASWSSKDGSGQPTNYDFAGQPITDPATANWTAVYPRGKNERIEVTYVFCNFMWVTPEVSII